MIPPESRRTPLLNVISAVRTAYQGVSTVFRYQLRDHDALDRKWVKLMAAVVYRPPVHNDAASLITDPPPLLRPAPQMVLSDIRLFRHERLVTLRDLPHFYEYRLHVRSHYDADYLFPLPHTPPVGDHAARREPKVLAWRPARMEPPEAGDQEEATLQIELRLTRTGDLLTPDEWTSSPPLEKANYTVATEAGGTISRQISGDQLPDPCMSYHLYYLATGPANGQGTAANNYYVSIGELLMPWHQAYKPREGQALNPWFRLLDSRVSYVTPPDLNDASVPSDEWPPIVMGQSEHGTPSLFDEPAYIVQLNFKVRKAAGDSELLFAEGSRRFLQVCRNGKLSEPTAQEN